RRHALEGGHLGATPGHHCNLDLLRDDLPADGLCEIHQTEELWGSLKVVVLPSHAAFSVYVQPEKYLYNPLHWQNTAQQAAKRCGIRGVYDGIIRRRGSISAQDEPCANVVAASS